MKSIFHSHNPLQPWPASSSDHPKHHSPMIERNPVAAIGLAVAGSLLAGIAWTTVMLWWTHQ